MVSWVRDLTDQDDIRCLAHGILEGHVEGVGVYADLPLGHQATPMLVDELHRILHRQYVAVAVLVAITDHGRLGGGLASARGTDEQHQPALAMATSCRMGGSTNSSKVGDTGLDTTQHHARHILLPEGADPESAKSFAVDGVVCLPAMQVSLEVRLVQAIPDQGQRRLPVQRPPPRAVPGVH